MDLIKISDHEGQQVVSARELHGFLGVATRFDHWAGRCLLDCFEENVDYLLVVQKRPTNNPRNPLTEMTDYALTLDCAKELSMLQRSGKGKEARRYFIECEKQLRAIASPSVLPSVRDLALMVIQSEDARIAAEEAQKRAELEAEKQKALVQELAPQAEYTQVVLTSVSTFRTTQIAVELNMSAIKLNNTLEQMKVQHKVKGEWCLNAKYQGKGYTESSTHVYRNSIGATCTSISTVWTEAGRKFIHDLLNPNLNKALKPADN